MVPNHHREPVAKRTTGRIRKENFKPRPSGDGVGREAVWGGKLDAGVLWSMSAEC